MKKFYFKVKEIYVGRVAAYGKDEEDAWEKVNEAANCDEIYLRFVDRDINDISETIENRIKEGYAFEEEYPVVGDEQEEK